MSGFGRACADEEARRGLGAHDAENYRRPEARKRATGSTTGIGSRLNNMRATAKPIAAYQIWINFISNPQVQLSPSHRGEQSAATLNPNTRKVNEPKVPCHCTNVIGSTLLGASTVSRSVRWQTFETSAISETSFMCAENSGEGPKK